MTLPCVQCKRPVEFPEPSGDATCGACGIAQYVNADGGQGRYPTHLGTNPLGRR